MYCLALKTYSAKPYKRQKNKKLVLKLGIQTYQTLTSDEKVCIPSLSSILLAVILFHMFPFSFFFLANNKNKTTKEIYIFSSKL